MKKTFKSIILCLFAAITLVTSLCIPASAASKSYTKSFTGGAKPVSWCKTTVYYYSTITYADWRQDCGGIGASAGGVKKLNCSSNWMYYLNAKTKFDASVSKTLSIGIKRTWTDQLRFDCAGNFRVTKDV